MKPIQIVCRDSFFFAIGNKGAGYLKNGSLGGVGGGGYFTNCTTNTVLVATLSASGFYRGKVGILK